MVRAKGKYDMSMIMRFRIPMSSYICFMISIAYSMSSMNLFMKSVNFINYDFSSKRKALKIFMSYEHDMMNMKF